jgi:hypothetical protein
MTEYFSALYAVAGLLRLVRQVMVVDEVIARR